MELIDLLATLSEPIFDISLYPLRCVRGRLRIDH